MKPVDYKQTDPRWKDKDYSAKGETTTIAKAGCGPTCMAMVIATLADKRVTPADTCAWALEHGYKARNQGTYYTYFGPQGKAYGLTVEQVNGANLKTVSKAREYHDKALQAIKDGHMVICCMGPGLWTKNGHYILWHGVDGDKVLINDPGSSQPGRAKAPLSLLQAEVKYYWVVKVPKGEEDDMKEIKAIIGGKRVTAHLDKDGKAQIPAASLRDLGLKVTWDAKTETVIVEKGE